MKSKSKILASKIKNTKLSKLAGKLPGAAMMKHLKKKGFYISLWSLALLASLSWGKISPAQEGTTNSPVQLVLQADKQTRVIDESSGAERLVWQDLQESAQVLPGDLIRYQLVAENKGAEPLSSPILTQPIPAQTVYVLGSAKGNDFSTIAYSIDGGETFVANPTMVINRNSSNSQVGLERSLRRVPALPQAYTHIRWKMREALQPGASVTVEFQVQVR